MKEVCALLNALLVSTIIISAVFWAVSNNEAIRARPTVNVSKRAVDGDRNSGPHAHITWIAVCLDQRSIGVGYQLPVHAAGNDVSASVVAPDESGVQAVDVPREAGIGQRTPGHRVPLRARQLPVARTCCKTTDNIKI